MGATIARHTLVTDVKQRPNGEWEVITDQGNVVCEMVVNAAGCYARQVSQMVGTDVPITNMEHTYLVTEPIPEFVERDEEMVVVRDPYTSGYLRQEQKAGLIGIYETADSAECWTQRGGLAGVGIGERAVRGEPRPARALRGACSGAGADLARRRHQAHRVRRHPPHPGREPAARPGRRAAQLLAVLRRLHRHRGRARAAASTWRSGWCTATARSTWPASTRAGSAAMPPGRTRKPSPTRTTSTCMRCTCPVRNAPPRAASA